MSTRAFLTATRRLDFPYGVATAQLAHRNLDGHWTFHPSDGGRSGAPPFSPAHPNCYPVQEAREAG
ncbi:hypothetical protein NITHO_1430003 [Nitrolancea hollandica Lb]|uniref:Uncharacterized protein n=1 Tax=Nitrolancea hollandica Lb TaxID=1129897 RepID=I4EDB1_9BACT|nr:hypothetical protein NITHO_1430003 [Nitrolancea hollandica Lb]